MRHVIAKRSDAMGGGPTAEEWARSVDGVDVIAASNPERVVVEASPELADEVRRRSGGTLIVEAEVTFRPSSHP